MGFHKIQSWKWTTFIDHMLPLSKSKFNQTSLNGICASIPSKQLCSILPVCPGIHFTKDFSRIIKKKWNFHFIIILFLTTRAIQNVIVVTRFNYECEYNEISNEFAVWWKNYQWNGSKIYKWCFELSHWGWVTHICIGKLTIIGPNNGLSPGRHQAIIWTNAGILLIGLLGTNFSEILIQIQTFSLRKIRLKMSSAICCPFHLGLNVFSPPAVFV